MTVTYPTCPACGTMKRGRPLVPAETPYRHGVAHNHGDCDVSRYIVTVHPDGTVEPESVVPKGASLEEELVRRAG